MNDLLCAEDPEPSERVPAGPLYVPVRPGPAGCATRLFRTPLGERTAVGFTSRERLIVTLGEDQRWIRLAEPALRAIAGPLGVTAVTVDPTFSAPATAAPLARDGARNGGDRWQRQVTGVARVSGVARVTGAAAVADALALWIH
ncbi:SAV_915 family protein [Streptomyces sp. NPDC102467]|uniref:SAV_915 family protein n=1 Tax=Streptomyces sp. NPDC102467 TaxID=3366179 RepID=UPI003828DD92